jgi:dienelactone hydrolase
MVSRNSVPLSEIGGTAPMQWMAGLGALVLSILAASGSWAASPGPQEPERPELREQVWRIPAVGGSLLMEATVMRPPGEARRPLAVINHGTPSSGTGGRATMKRPRYASLAVWLVDRGYVVVLPVRRGYGGTGGPFAEDYGRCGGPDYAGAGLQGANDVQATIDYMRSQPFVAADRTLVLGGSSGGWAGLALSSRNPSGVSRIVNIAGGRGDNGHLVCMTPELVRAAGQYGKTARLQTLWLYASNDHNFDPPLAQQMADAYVAGGGLADLRILPPFGKNGHNIACDCDEKRMDALAPPLASFLPRLQ